MPYEHGISTFFLILVVLKYFQFILKDFHCIFWLALRIIMRGITTPIILLGYKRRSRGVVTKVSRKFLYEGGKEHNNLIAISGSRILTLMFCKSIIIDKNSSKWDLSGLTSFILRSWCLYLSSRRLVTLFCHINDSNFNHNPATVISLATYLKTSLDRDKWIIERAFKSICSHLSSIIPEGFLDSPSRALWQPLWPRWISSSIDIGQDSLGYRISQCRISLT